MNTQAITFKDGSKLLYKKCLVKTKHTIFVRDDMNHVYMVNRLNIRERTSVKH